MVKFWYALIKSKINKWRYERAVKKHRRRWPHLSESYIRNYVYKMMFRKK